MLLGGGEGSKSEVGGQRSELEVGGRGLNLEESVAFAQTLSGYLWGMFNFSLILGPISRSASASSYRDCKFIQKRALLPK